MLFKPPHSPSYQQSLFSTYLFGFLLPTYSLLFPFSSTTNTMSDLDHAKYLLSIPSVRARSSLLFSKVVQDPNEACTNFTVDFSKVDSVVDFIINLIKRDYGTNFASIPLMAACSTLMSTVLTASALWLNLESQGC